MIIMDYNMPICDGPTAIMKIREICLQIKTGINTEYLKHLNPFILVLTGYHDQFYMRNAIKKGADQVAVKPLSTE